jgi:hypothetical protein
MENTVSFEVLDIEALSDAELDAVVGGIALPTPAAFCG